VVGRRLVDEADPALAASSSGLIFGSPAGFVTSVLKLDGARGTLPHLKHCRSAILFIRRGICPLPKTKEAILGPGASAPPGGASSKQPLNRLFSDIAQATSRAAGRTWVFVLAVAIIVVWAASGPFFGFSDTWQLVINTGTTIVTFLMVFLIQNAQNRDAAAIQVKLDELIRVSRARNSFVGIEHLTDKELDEIRTLCEARAKGRATAGKTGSKANSTSTSAK
jgi:low affinity Fe/Cu permease